ncbi:hypothetical protein [Staphylococcus nepalensis]|uniref:hypothetical protein n=1 Tax=Staphylococcus nepalensis TaxID=214473 RepID=UPI001C3EC86B|nr:hypothetical protein [Staphylococcus nepalensis]
MKKIDFKTLITILFIIMLFIFAFILSVGYVLSNIDPKNKLQGYAIAISFIGIFATFGGAYFGAKISGENASKLSKKENMINDLRNTLQYNNKILDKFNREGLSFELEIYLSDRNFNNVLDLNGYHIKFMQLKSNYDYFVKTNNFENIFPLLSYEFNELKEKLNVLGDNLFKCIHKIDIKVQKLVNQQGYDNFNIYGYGSGLNIYHDEKENIAIVEISYNNEIEKVKIDLIELNKAINYTDIENVNLALKNARVYWHKFKFKSKEDIRNFIAEYYGDYE